MAETCIERFCATCGRKTGHRRRCASHVLHLLLTLLTLGFWLPLWILAGLCSYTEHAYCIACGTRYRARAARRRKRELEVS